MFNNNMILQNKSADAIFDCYEFDIFGSKLLPIHGTPRLKRDFLDLSGILFIDINKLNSVFFKCVSIRAMHAGGFTASAPVFMKLTGEYSKPFGG